jgi:hypothetical protein
MLCLVKPLEMALYIHDMPMKSYYHKCDQGDTGSGRGKFTGNVPKPA